MKKKEKKLMMIERVKKSQSALTQYRQTCNEELITN